MRGARAFGIGGRKGELSAPGKEPSQEKFWLSEQSLHWASRPPSWKNRKKRKKRLPMKMRKSRKPSRQTKNRPRNAQAARTISLTPILIFKHGIKMCYFRIDRH